MVEYNIHSSEEEPQIDVEINEEGNRFIPPHSCIDVERICDLFNGKKQDEM